MLLSKIPNKFLTMFISGDCAGYSGPNLKMIIFMLHRCFEVLFVQFSICFALVVRDSTGAENI